MSAKLNYLYLTKHPFIKEIILILFFGTLSYLFGLIKVVIPGIEGSVSDLREIPLLISILYISNPISFIFISLISALNTITIGSFASTFLAHAISLIISWYLYRYLKKQKLHITIAGIILILYVGFFYIGLIIPLIILFNDFFGLGLYMDFFSSYKQFVFSARFEIITTAIIVSLYFIQYRLKNTLRKHKYNLELTVKKRTKELEISYDKLKSLNEELSVKSLIINKQNAELNASLQHIKKTQKQLFQSEKMASLGILTAGVAHEINNPLNYIMGGLIGLENYFQETGKQSDNITLCLKSIKTGVERASEIVKGLNQLSRRNDVFDETCNIHSIINNSLLMLKNELTDNIELSTDFCVDLISIPCNNGKLHQVFINILTNAIHSIDKQGKITISTRMTDTNVIIQITDNGCGIIPENLKKITDPFYTTKDPGKGTGLGLSITYTIIQEHKGNLEFQSELNKGTTVSISLPL